MTITQDELENYLWGAATILRGVIDPAEYKSVIFPLMFFKRLSDVYTEEYKTAFEVFGDEESAKFSENHVFQIPENSHWNDIRQVTSNVGHSIKTAMISIEKSNPDRLTGIFGDINWTNKDRLSDTILSDLIEHFSSITLNIKNVPEDEFGRAYEYLIKKFADDSGHNAAEFYTNRTVVRLMTLIVDPRPGDSIYDPTCGSGGMLINARNHVKEKGKEFRSLKLYGQEINIITSSIARINMFIHGVQDFEIIQGDTLRKPAFIEHGKLKQFDICLANPPYSMSHWDREFWINDPWGRNKWGIPPRSNADYAFLQHILCSLKFDVGRCSILLPNGILERDAERDIRKKIVDDDLIDCVIGLGKDFFYNSPMESCILFCRTNKQFERKNRILFINAKDKYIRIKNQNFLDENHIKEIYSAYVNYENIDGFSKIIDINEIRKNDYNLNIKYYIPDNQYLDTNLLNTPLDKFIEEWAYSKEELSGSIKEMVERLKEVMK